MPFAVRGLSSVSPFLQSAATFTASPRWRGMRSRFLSVSTLLIVLGFGPGSFTAQGDPATKKEKGDPVAKITAKPTLPPLTSDYKLVWEDDFTKDPDGFPDPKKWSFEKGYVRNNEPQYYAANRAENVRIEKGHLILELRKEAFTPPDDDASAYGGSSHGKSWSRPKSDGKFLDPKKAEYTGGSITTCDHASWCYGRMEFRAKMPAGLGPWPALWTLGVDDKQVGWPRCGEIDLLEMQNKPFNIVWSNFHYAINGKHVSSDHAGIDIPDSSTAFHTYTIDWDTDHINTYADGIQIAHFDVKKADEAGQNPYRKPHYLIMNTALYGGKIDDSIFPQQMVVDYVRVYQKPAATP
jgi:beta-glucanase (GH16 family)